MSSSLTNEQAAAVRQWADDGADLPQIQKRLDEEFELRLTFMDTRFLIDDLGIELQSPEEEEEGDEPEAAAEAGGIDPSENDSAGDGSELTAPLDPEVDQEAPAGGKVSVTISELQRPGMVASGTVTFAGGEKAEWYLDQLGRLGMNPENPDFRPSPQDQMDFQQELQRLAQKGGL